MTGTQDSRWVALSALGAAMFAIGFSVTGVACSTRDVSVSEAGRAAQSATAVPAPAASLGAVVAVVNGSASAVAPVAPPAASTSGAKLGQTAEGLTLKRFVVTKKIENREPVAGTDFQLGSAPVYAFVELENSGASAQKIRVLFQNEETKATVGHARLSVPASQSRFRTWGNTRMIREPGHWVAIVSTSDGVELGRAPFEVKG